MESHGKDQAQNFVSAILIRAVSKTQYIKAQIPASRTIRCNVDSSPVYLIPPPVLTDLPIELMLADDADLACEVPGEA